MTEKLLEFGRDAIGNIMHTLCREWVGSLSAGVARSVLVWLGKSLGFPEND
jgi:hypothetical protein